MNDKNYDSQSESTQSFKVVKAITVGHAYNKQNHIIHWDGYWC